MSAIFPAMRIMDALQKFTIEQIYDLADYKIGHTDIQTIKLAREQKMFSCVPLDSNVFEVESDLFPHSNARLRQRLFFFGETEKDVLDRLMVAEILLA